MECCIMRLNKEQYRKMDRLNKRLDQWNKQKAKPYIIQEVEDMLLMFYNRENISTERMSAMHFKKKGEMTQEQIDELEAIADMMESAPESKVQYAKYHYEQLTKTEKAYQTAKGRYGVQIDNFADYLEFIDRMKNVNNRVKEYYDSKEIAKIYDYGIAEGLTESEVNKIMVSKARAKTTPHDERYDKTINMIDRAVARKREKQGNAMINAGGNNAIVNTGVENAIISQ